MVSKEDVIEMFEELKVDWSEDMFIAEPEYTLGKLLAYENMYPHSSLEIGKMEECPNDVIEKDFKEWQILQWQYEVYVE